MFEGQPVFRLTGMTMYTVPFAALGQTGQFRVVVEGFNGASSLSIVVESRNPDDTAWTGSGAFPPIAADGSFSVVVGPLKQIVRLGVSFTGAGGAATDSAYIQFQTPGWMDY